MIIQSQSLLRHQRHPSHHHNAQYHPHNHHHDFDRPEGVDLPGAAAGDGWHNIMVEHHLREHIVTRILVMFLIGFLSAGRLVGVGVGVRVN